MAFIILMQINRKVACQESKTASVVYGKERNDGIFVAHGGEVPA